MAFYGAVRPLHANRQIGNTFDIEPQDIYLYMNELASLLALEKLTLAGISEAKYLSLPFSSPRHACKASRRRSRGSHILLPKWSPRGHDREFYFSWASVVRMRRAFFFLSFFSSSGHPRPIGMIFLSTLQLTCRLYGRGARKLANLPPLIIFICHVNGRSDQVSRRRESFVR